MGSSQSHPSQQDSKQESQHNTSPNSQQSTTNITNHSNISSSSPSTKATNVTNTNKDESKAEKSSSSSASSISSKEQTSQASSGYSRAQLKCQSHKRAYDRCYTKQLSGRGEECYDLFETYRKCFMKEMMSDMERRGVGVGSGSMLGEFREEMEEEEEG